MPSTANGTATSATAVPNVDTTSQLSSSRKLRLASAPRTVSRSLTGGVSRSIHPRILYQPERPG